MSLLELKSAIRRLPSTELAEIEVLLAELRAETGKTRTDGPTPGPTLDRTQAMDHVFKNYAPLLRRLAE